VVPTIQEIMATLASMSGPSKQVGQALEAIMDGVEIPPGTLGPSGTPKGTMFLRDDFTWQNSYPAYEQPKKSEEGMAMLSSGAIQVAQNFSTLVGPVHSGKIPDGSGCVAIAGYQHPKSDYEEMAKQSNVDMLKAEMEALLGGDIEAEATKRIEVRGQKMVVNSPGTRLGMDAVLACLYAMGNHEVDKVLNELGIAGKFADGESFEIRKVVADPPKPEASKRIITMEPPDVVPRSGQLVRVLNDSDPAGGLAVVDPDPNNLTHVLLPGHVLIRWITGRRDAWPVKDLVVITSVEDAAKAILGK
jgi:hypothetical protein